jgi:hypothetical protein
MANATFSSFYCGLKINLPFGKINMQRKSSSTVINERRNFEKNQKKGQFYENKNQASQHFVALAYRYYVNANKHLCSTKN